jgi:hypothetical protein
MPLMADKPAQKLVSITVRRERPFPVKIIAATGFKLRLEKSTGLIEVLIETCTQKGERIIFDPIITRSNLEHLKQFVAGTRTEPDDAAQKEDVSVGEQSTFSNIIHLSRMENRGETIFSVFSPFDWVAATRQTTGVSEISSIDNIVLMSSAAFQKKLLLEIILLISNISQP